MVRDHRQITFVTLNGFSPLSKKNPTLLFLTDNIKLDGIPSKIKMENTHLFYFVIQVLKVLLKSSYKV